MEEEKEEEQEEEEEDEEDEEDVEIIGLTEDEHEHDTNWSDTIAKGQISSQYIPILYWWC